MASWKNVFLHKPVSFHFHDCFREGNCNFPNPNVDQIACTWKRPLLQVFIRFAHNKYVRHLSSTQSPHARTYILHRGSMNILPPSSRKTRGKQSSFGSWSRRLRPTRGRARTSGRPTGATKRCAGRRPTGGAESLGRSVRSRAGGQSCSFRHCLPIVHRCPIYSAKSSRPLSLGTFPLNSKPLGTSGHQAIR